MRTFNVVVERDPETGTYVGHVPGWPGAHTQGDSLDELQTNLREVIAMLLEDGDHCPGAQAQRIARPPVQLVSVTPASHGHKTRKIEHRDAARSALRRIPPLRQVPFRLPRLS
jgi:predicted RNase H-like HicB family nuclease